MSDKTQPQSQFPRPIIAPSARSVHNTASSIRTASNPAADMVRTKINALHKSEPALTKELKEAAQSPTHSVHQQYLLSLKSSGKTTHEVQALWHSYYATLDDVQKNIIWQEFEDQKKYLKQPNKVVAESPAKIKKPTSIYPTIETEPKPEIVATYNMSEEADAKSNKIADARREIESSSSSHLNDQMDALRQVQPETIAQHSTHQQSQQHQGTHQAQQHQQSPAGNRYDVREKILNKVNSRAHAERKMSKAAHLKSLGFGLSMGAVFILIIMFSFFNERFITPFITPSKYAINSSIIIDPNAPQTVSLEAKVVIPKLNIEAPVVYDSATTAEGEIQKALESGTYHYPTTAKPGESGNVIIFGHSSNNILNSGKFKFVFLKLKELSVGDVFYLHYKGTRYTYRIFNTRIVSPKEVAVLNQSPKPNMATLITCDPPGTSLNRLLIEAEQINPDVTKNGASTASASTTNQPVVLPSNSPSLLSRIFN
jgi:LPXTG-site transpeptidase (sortase) family protein